MKEKKVAQKSTPSSARVGSSSAQLNRARSEFVGAALSMSWQLALIVLIPVIGGYKIDLHFNTLPAFTIAGFILAMIGVFLLIRKTLSEFDPGGKDV